MKSADQFPIGWTLTSGAERLLTVPLSTVLRSTLITGTTGWGKSGAVLSLMLTALTKFRPVGVVLVDCKSETANTLIEEMLPALGERYPHLDPSQVVVVKPFGRRYGIPLNPLVPIPGLDAAVQAHIVASLIADLVDGNSVGPRMKSLLSSLCHAGILARATAFDLLTVLREPGQAHALASRVQDQDVRHYLTAAFPKEPAASRDALRARLEWLLLIPEVRTMLTAPSAISGRDLLEAPLTIIDLGGDIPLGFLPLAEVIGSWLMTLLTTAVFSRQTPAHPVMLIIDEWQVVIGKSAAELERTLSQARFRGVNLVLANQTLGQITNPSLLRSLLTNISLHYAFRPAEKDVEHLLPLLPLCGRYIDPERPDQLLSKDAERRRLVERLTKLKPRHALFATLVEGRADIVRTLTGPYAEAQQRASQVPATRREAYRRGKFGVPFDELQHGGVQSRLQSASGAVPPPLSAQQSKPTRAPRARLVLP